MKIRAEVSYELHEVYIIGFVTRFENYVYAVYVNAKGKVSYCDIDHVTILDPNYIP